MRWKGLNVRALFDGSDQDITSIVDQDVDPPVEGYGFLRNLLQIFEGVSHVQFKSFSPLGFEIIDLADRTTSGSSYDFISPVESSDSKITSETGTMRSKD